MLADDVRVNGMWIDLETWLTTCFSRAVSSMVPVPTREREAGR